MQVTRTDLQIAECEKAKAILQIKQTAGKLYFGLLIVQKQKEEATIKLQLARRKLVDVENAVRAGKTTESSKTGLLAGVIEEEENLLKLNVRYAGYLSDLKHLAGLAPSFAVELDLDSVNTAPLEMYSPEAPMQSDSTDNHDLKIALLNQTKADYAVLASRYSYLPDIRIHGGYVHQGGNLINPRHDVLVGAFLIWNIQDAISNTFISRQRVSMKKQAREYLENTQKQVNKDIEKASRHLEQSEKLIALTRKVLDYRREDLKIQADRRKAGLNLETDFLAAQAALARAESDNYAALLNYRMAVTDLKILAGKY